MSATTGPTGGEERCRLETVTCWPLIHGAGGVVLLGVIVALGLFLSDSLRAGRRLAEARAPVEQPPEPTSANLDRGPDLPFPLSGDVVVSRQRQKSAGNEGSAHLPPWRKWDPSQQWGMWKDADSLPAETGWTEEEEPVVISRPQAATTTQFPTGAFPAPASRDANALESLLVGNVRDLDLEAERGATSALMEASKKHAEQMKLAREKKTSPLSVSTPLEKLLAVRADLRGLPLLTGKLCETSKEQVQVVGLIAAQSRARMLSLSASCEPELAVRPLEQLCQGEPTDGRIKLSRMLAKIPTEEATQALARRAVYDLSPEVRGVAITALKKRGVAEGREVFLAALRHPWPPVADHAAIALVELQDRGAVPELLNLLELLDPLAPAKDKGGNWRRKELVRVNHLRNCLLCHPPSLDVNDPLRGVVPVPGEPLPPAYYKDVGPKATWVRADVVYFRQDFSAMHAVKEPNKWPEVQRFDYLVQTRELKAEEAEAALTIAKAQKTYPQREAVRWALAKLEEERMSSEEK